MEKIWFFAPSLNTLMICASFWHRRERESRGIRKSEFRARLTPWDGSSWEGSGNWCRQRYLLSATLCQTLSCLILVEEEINSCLHGTVFPALHFDIVYSWQYYLDFRHEEHRDLQTYEYLSDMWQLKIARIIFEPSLLDSSTSVLWFFLPGTWRQL